jgi:hypothetical protein
MGIGFMVFAPDFVREFVLASQPVNRGEAWESM